jgi:hypothetical protein
MVNLLALTKAIEHTDVTLSGKGQIIYLTVGTTEIDFEKEIKHGSGLKSIPLQITFLPLLRRWTSMLYIKCLAIPTHKYLQPRLENMVFTPTMIFMFAPTVPSAKQNRIIYISLLLIRTRNWEGELILIFPVFRTPVMKEQIFGYNSICFHQLPMEILHQGQE